MDRQVLRRELIAIGLTLLSVFIVGSLLFQREASAGARCLDATGIFGPAGSYLRCALVWSVGIPGALLIALGCIVVALVLFGRGARLD